MVVAHLHRLGVSTLLEILAVYQNRAGSANAPWYVSTLLEILGPARISQFLGYVDPPVVSTLLEILGDRARRVLQGKGAEVSTLLEILGPTTRR